MMRSFGWTGGIPAPAGEPVDDFTPRRMFLPVAILLVVVVLAMCGLAWMWHTVPHRWNNCVSPD